jgi:hypothetical protein
MLDAAMIAFLFLNALCIVFVLADWSSETNR